MSPKEVSNESSNKVRWFLYFTMQLSFEEIICNKVKLKSMKKSYLYNVHIICVIMYISSNLKIKTAFLHENPSNYHRAFV